MNKIISPLDGLKTLIAGIFKFGPIRSIKIMNQGGKRLEDFRREYGRYPTKTEWAIISRYDAIIEKEE